MKTLCDQHNTVFVMVILPDLLRVPLTSQNLYMSYPYHDVHQMVCTYMETHHIVCLDLTTYFADYKLRDIVVHPLDHHFNQQGNALVAQLLMQYFETTIASLQNHL
jgi:hypothetical protein